MGHSELEKKFLEKFSQEQLDAEIRKKIDGFQGLLTKEAALRLIAKEKGLIKESSERLAKVSGIKKGARKINIDAKVRKVHPLVAYPTGTKSRRVEIADETGSITLVLWNDDCRLAGRMRSGDRVFVKRAYEKNGELSVGYSGVVGITSRARFTPLAELEEGGQINIRAFVKSIDGHDRFVRGNSTRPGFSFVVSDGKNEVRCIIWGNTGRGESLEGGDEVILENAIVRGGELFLPGDSRIFLRKKGVITGEVEELECENDKLVIRVAGNRYVLGKKKALEFLGVSVADDVGLSTVVSLKKDAILHTTVVLEKPERNEG